MSPPPPSLKTSNSTTTPCSRKRSPQSLGAQASRLLLKRTSHPPKFPSREGFNAVDLRDGVKKLTIHNYQLTIHNSCQNGERDSRNNCELSIVNAQLLMKKASPILKSTVLLLSFPAQQIYWRSFVNLFRRFCLDIIAFYCILSANVAFIVYQKKYSYSRKTQYQESTLC